MARVLVVDDDPNSRYYQESLLKANGYEVIGARNGAEAIELAHRDPPDVLLTDVLMPQMDGFELCRNWLADTHLRGRPVIVYTATYTDPSDEELALKLGAYAFIRKPARPERVLSTISSAMASEPPPTSYELEPLDKSVYLEKYNSALIRKLEDKLEELGEKNRELERSLAELDASMKRERALLVHLRQAQRLEAQGQMAASLAHDFNNLLMTITYSVDLARTQLPEDHPARSDMEVAGQGLTSAGALVRQIAAVGRKQALRVQRIDLAEGVSRLVPLLSTACGKLVHVELLPNQHSHFALVDPAQLEQVMLNLAINARDAMPDGGTLRIEITTLELDESTAAAHELPLGSYEVLRVSDTGIGMDEEVRRRIFETYFTTKPAGKGSGLGLAICYGIIRQSGGTIRVTSSPGDGTTIEVLLPTEVEAVAPGRVAAPPSRP